MHRLLLIFCAIVCCGFTIVTPEMVQDREKLCSQVRHRYGEKKLTAFVKDVIAKHPRVDEFKLADSKIGKKWVTMEWNPSWHLISEDWAIRVGAEKNGDPAFSKFTMLWMPDKKHGVIVEGHREESGTLILDSIRSEEMAEINWL
jgi:hypothetical protein